MRCEYGDGLKVNYSGPFQVTKGKDVNVFIKEEMIPNTIKDDLEMALFKNSCKDMREVADTVTKTYGPKACIH